MSLLHDYFNTRNLQAFQRLLDGSAERNQASRTPPSSAPTGSYTAKSSWTRNASVMGHQKSSSYEVNARDWLGRTALHLACASLESIEYVRALLKHPQIDVNLPDIESQWTPLHRALYSANFPAALLLLQRSEVDSSLKDLEGYTAFDLYNSTLNGTKPDMCEVDTELYTWGANRNAALGVGDEDDRLHPEHIHIKPKDDPSDLAKMSLSARFSPIYVRQIRMSKLHTVVVTSEKEGNLRVCGFGSGGRLGIGQSTQFSLKPLSNLPFPISSVALGQDHTLALTTAGEVYSWGLNHFSQLGYVVEMPSGTLNRLDEPIQFVPKRVVGALRKEIVRGVAASKKASACWTSDSVFTWGTNMGHFGYDKSSQPVQIYPRAVTKFTNTVISLSMSDTVLAALLTTGQVECIWNDRQSRVVFPMHSFSPSFQVYRPLQAVKDAHIVKITCCDENFAALSSNGEVFTFIAPTETSSADSRGAGPVFKPQKVWALRKKFSAVKDVALSSDGSIIICTESGHVFVRMRNTKASSNKAFKFERVSFLQRVVQVCANRTGAFGALRTDHRPTPIEVTGNNFAQDLKAIQPYLAFYRHSGPSDDGHRQTIAADTPTIEDEPEDASIQADIESLLELIEVLSVEQRFRKAGGGNVRYEGVRFPHDADTVIHTSFGAAFPVHRVILAARCLKLDALLSRSLPLIDTTSKLSIKVLPAKPGPGFGVLKLTRMTIAGCHPLSLLIFLRYLYSDELLAVWDRRIGLTVEKQLAKLDVNPNQIKVELRAFARLLELPALLHALEPPVKREPAPTMAQDMTLLFEKVQQPTFPSTSALLPNVILELEDKEVHTHSAILRARTALFGSFFDLNDWTVKRWSADAKLRINMKHMRWHSFRFVAAIMCGGQDRELFHSLDVVHSIEGLLDLMFEVASLANELLLDRLILICASVILAHSNMQNACYILADSTYYSIPPLTERLQEYISINMESFLQGHMLDEVSYSLVKQLAIYVRARQMEKSSFSRTSAFVSSLLEKHASWLEEQDIPAPVTRRAHREPFKKEPSGTKLSPEISHRALPRTAPFSTPTKGTHPGPILPTPRRDSSGDDVFLMDEADLAARPSSYQEPITFPVSPPPTWKATSAPRADMKAIMAEAEAVSQNQASLTRQRSSQNVSQSSRSATTIRPSPNTSDPRPSPSKASSSRTWRVAAGDSRQVTSVDFPPVDEQALKPRPTVTGALSATRSQKDTQSTPSTSRSQPAGFGPVITPTRTTPKPGSSNSKAWVSPSVQPTPKASPSTTSGMSFAEIQDSQKKQVPPVMDKRTLKEIQEEEQSLQAEADFLKWWTAEEERVKEEAQALAQFEKDFKEQQHSSEKSAKPAKAKGSNRKKSEGKAPERSEQNLGEGSSKHQASVSEIKTGKKVENFRRKPRKPKEPHTNTS
ncbi:hypothetical protein CPB83DRAFT_894990 [Crepidotus variabilis]|uniref:BTB domain-containing protein n=1 Tax=Crepidotus variabilis TaxID=179855 RepID=A0A9P6JPL2_9AGAR|nr:hypothetical protein CPB83DRAFT_894990 [Crepidotus variabilis]